MDTLLNTKFTSISQLSDDDIIEMVNSTVSVDKLFASLSNAAIGKRQKKDIILKAISNTHGLPYADSLERIKAYSKMSPEFMIKLAANNGDIRVVTSFVDSLDVNNSSDALEEALDRAAIGAVLNGHKDVVDKLMTVSEGIPLQRLHFAIQGGNNDMISYFIKLNGGIDRELLGVVIVIAAEYGHMDILKHFINLLNSWDGSEPKHCTDRMPPFAVPTYSAIINSAMHRAAVNGQKDSIKYLIDTMGSSSLDYNRALISAVGNVHPDRVDNTMEIVKMLMSAGATKLDIATLFAAEYGNIDVVRELLLAGASNYEEVADIAWFEEHNNIETLVYHMVYQNGPHV